MKPSSLNGEKARAFVKTIVTQSLDIPVGPPHAVLAVDVIEPGYYQLKHIFTLQKKENGGARLSVSIDFKPRDANQPKQEARATVVLLHGIFMSKETMMHWGVYLAEHGYRSVLVDLRGHGHSTGKWITYGQLESTDLIQVADELVRRGLAEQGLGVIGMSYGAVVGIHWASQDPRVRALVALQPYSDLESAVVGVARGNFGSITKGISDNTFHHAILRAPSMAGFSWTEVDVLSSVRRLKIPLLVYHGKDDNWVLPSHSEAIAAVAPEGSQLYIMHGEYHESLSLRLDPIAKGVIDWFQTNLEDRSKPRPEDN